MIRMICDFSLKTCLVTTRNCLKNLTMYIQFTRKTRYFTYSRRNHQSFLKNIPNIRRLIYTNTLHTYISLTTRKLNLGNILKLPGTCLEQCGHSVRVYTLLSLLPGNFPGNFQVGLVPDQDRTYSMFSHQSR